MRSADEIRFHSHRAMAELECATNAGCTQAARAHFGLSQLHLDRMRELAAIAADIDKPRRPSLSAAA